MKINIRKDAFKCWHPENRVIYKISINITDLYKKHKIIINNAGIKANI